MIINTNLAAMNTNRQMSINEAATNSSLAKLSSGFRINSAADDPAGLAISEQMRGQISGLNQASSNAQDGISLVSTAEGALNTTTSVLQSMRELAVQAANGTNTTSDIAALQTEMNQYASAIDDIGNQTQFNTKNLLDGTMAGASGVALGENSTTSAVVGKLTAATYTATTAMTAVTAMLTTAFTAATITVDGTNIGVNFQNLDTTDQATIEAGFGANATTTSENAAASLIVSTINSAIDASGSNVAHITGYVDGAGKLNLESGSTGTNSQISYTNAGADTNVLAEAIGDGHHAANTVSNAGTDIYSGTTVNNGSSFNININGVQMLVTTGAAYTGGTTGVGAVATDLQTQINASITAYDSAQGLTSGQTGYIAATTVNATADGRLQVDSQSGAVSFSDTSGNTYTTDLGLNAASTTSGGGALTFQVGANAGQTMSLSIGDMRSSALGVSSLDLSTTASAQAAITTIDAATSKVSSQRAVLGAAQNRLTDTISNLGTSSQNITSAEADIRDVDMASEMTNFQKNNILQQAAQAMLAQANQLPQGVLQLLK
jgi:flagellin